MGIGSDRLEAARATRRGKEQDDILSLTSKIASLRAALFGAYFQLDHIADADYLRVESLQATARRAAEDVHAALHPAGCRHCGLSRRVPQGPPNEEVRLDGKTRPKVARVDREATS